MRTGTLVPVENQRNYGIDALRSVSMFMVVVMHILSKGGIFQVVEKRGGITPDYLVAWFLELFCFVAVNCFALITGYFGVRGKYRYANLATLWLRVVFYTLTITLVFQIFFPEYVTWQKWVKAFFPVSFAHYWYFTAYFILFLLIPFFNLALHKLSAKQSGALIIGLIFALSVIQTFPNTDVFNLKDGGHSGWWIMVMYLIGAYIGKYRVFDSWSKGKCLLIYLGASTFTFLTEIGLDLIKDDFPEGLFGTPLNKYFTHYCSPTVVIASVALFLFFMKLDIRSGILQKVIAFFAPLAFSVYLIHYTPLIRDNFLLESTKPLTKLSAPVMGLAVLGISLVIFIVCALIDELRELLFKKLRVRERLERLEDKLVGNLWKDYTK
jgi:surface polysaccharide O-acyltransferase-like enzyme